MKHKREREREREREQYEREKKRAIEKEQVEREKRRAAEQYEAYQFRSRIDAMYRNIRRWKAIPRCPSKAHAEPNHLCPRCPDTGPIVFCSVCNDLVFTLCANHCRRCFAVRDTNFPYCRTCLLKHFEEARQLRRSRLPPPPCQ